MTIKGIHDEDFINFRKPSMLIVASYCNFKCDVESGVSCCQNSNLASAKCQHIPDDILIKRYIQNPITKAIVFGGLEPFEQFNELYEFIFKLRFQYECKDDVVIYTGFNKVEISSEILSLKSLGNIIIKFGRYVPNQNNHYDEILGVYLASPNQYAEVIS